MLSLVVIFGIIAIIFIIRRAKKKKWVKWKITGISIIVTLLFFILLIEGAMYLVVDLNDTGYWQNRIDTLTQVNEQLNAWEEEIQEDLADNPELLNYVKEYLESKEEANNEEINRCIELQEDRTPLYRWLLYFG